MEHRFKVNFNSIESDDHSVNIVVKIKTADILKAAMKDFGRDLAKEYENVNLTVMVEQPKVNSSIHTKVNKISQQEYVNALMNDVSDWDGYGSPYNLVILRSNIIKFYKYIYYYLFNTSNTSSLPMDQKPKNKFDEEVVVSDESELFGESSLGSADMKRYTSKHKHKSVDGWNAQDFFDFISIKYKSLYGNNLIGKEDIDGNGKQKGKGYALAGIKNILMKRFLDMGKSNADVKLYLEWLFDVKALKLDFPVGIGFIVSNKVISEWLWQMKKNGNVVVGNIKPIVK